MVGPFAINSRHTWLHCIKDRRTRLMYTIFASTHKGHGRKHVVDDSTWEHRSATLHQNTSHCIALFHEPHRAVGNDSSRAEGACSSI